MKDRKFCNVCGTKFALNWDYEETCDIPNMLSELAKYRAAIDALVFASRVYLPTSGAAPDEREVEAFSNAHLIACRALDGEK